jgi:phenylacetate-CoA ligase
MWDREKETMSRNELIDLQLKRLKWTLKRAYENVPFYHRLFKEAGAAPDEIDTLDGLKRLPFTTKSDLQDNYPFGLFAVPRSEIARIHTSSGTRGKPTLVGYSQRDLDNWSDITARCLTMVGIGKGDVFQNAMSYGLFTGGLGLHYGAEKIGATVVPSATGNTERQIELMHDLGVTCIHCTPSYALFLAETAQEKGGLPEDLRVMCLGAEPWSENMRREIERLYNAKAYDSYGLSEMFGPGVAFECQEQDGLHIWDDHFLVEVLDQRGEPVDEGERGELVITSLTKEALPLIRYRTRDLTRFVGRECACGRTSSKISRILGRTDDMLIIRGINVFPSQIEHVLMGISEVGDHFQIVLRREHHLDEMEVRVEMAEKGFTGELSSLERIKEKIEQELHGALNLRTRVVLVERGSIPRTSGKSKRVLDLRGE